MKEGEDKGKAYLSTDYFRWTGSLIQRIAAVQKSPTVLFTSCAVNYSFIFLIYKIQFKTQRKYVTIFLYKTTKLQH